MTNTTNGIAVHNYGIFRVDADKTKKRFTDVSYVEFILEQQLGLNRENKKLIRNFIDKITFSPLPAQRGGAIDILAGCESDLRDEAFLRDAVQQILVNAVPSLNLPSGWRFRVHFVGRYGEHPQYAVDTNLDWRAINEIYHLYTPIAHSSFSPAYLLTFLISAREAEYYASRHMAELITDSVTSSVIRLKYFDMLRKRDRQCNEIDLFQTMIFPNGRSIREAINSGDRSFAEFLDLLDKASQFKRLLASQNPERSLLDAYYIELRKESWVDKLPSKSIRIVISSGLGLAAESLFPTGGISTLLGLGYSAFDSFLLDKVLKGWRPNQFIEDQLVPFVSGKG